MEHLVSCPLLLSPLLLPSAPAVCSCRQLLPSAPAVCSCRLLLPSAPALCSCRLPLLPPAPAACSFFGHYRRPSLRPPGQLVADFVRIPLYPLPFARVPRPYFP